jgi:chromosome segregation ATPase
MPNGENLQREIASLEQALREAVEQADRAEHALDELEGRRNEAAGRLAIARQAAENYAARLEDRRQALAHALEAEAKAKLLEAVAARDDAANRAAEAIAQLIASYQRLDAARAAMAERAAETESHLGRRPEVEPEPAKLEEEWARLIEFIRLRAQLLLDEEIVEAAASSPLGYEIKNLPQHLQMVARRRRAERMRSTSGGDAQTERDA